MTVARWVARLLVLGLLVASLLPIPNWIASERSAPWYREAATLWFGAGGLVIVVGVVTAWLAGRGSLAWREGAWSRAIAILDPANARVLGVVAAVAGTLYLAVALGIFDGRPLLIDEVILRFQARGYAAGRLSVAVDQDPAFRSLLHLVEHRGRWFGHFPPGWPVLLALGESVRAPWLIGPVVGAVAVAAWGVVLRAAEPRPAVRAGAVALFAVAPFVAFMAGSQMNHTATVMWLLVALAGWLAVERGGRWPAAVTAGTALGMAAITRPGEALAFAVPAAVWAAHWGWRRRSVGPLLIIAVAAAAPVAAMLWVNHETTGSALVSGYRLLWGAHQALGFHPAPSGPDHTMTRGFELVALYLLRLNRYLFEAPLPGLLAAATALVLAPRFSAVDRYLLASSAALLLLYFGYWHDGFYLGPRFLLPIVPLVVLWTVRLPSVLAELGWRFASRAATVSLGLAGLVAVGHGLPVRAAQNAAFQPGFRFDPDRAAADAGIANAVVLVRESWGAQLVARLWALGASRPDGERYYRNIDSCLLDQALADLERTAAPDLGRLVPMMADSARLVASPFSPDTSERVLDGARYDRRCLDRIAEDRAGTALLAPTILSRRTDLTFVRDLQARNRRVLEAYPGRAVFLLRRRPDSAAPRFEPVSRDSILRLVQ